MEQWEKKYFNKEATCIRVSWGWGGQGLQGLVDPSGTGGFFQSVGVGCCRLFIL